MLNKLSLKEFLDIFTQKDANDFMKLSVAGTDAQVQFTVNAFRIRFQSIITDQEQRKQFVYLLGRFVKSFHFLTCFFTYTPEIKELAMFSEYVGHQLIKQGSVSELMKQIRLTVVSKAAVEYKGEVRSGGQVKLKSGKGQKGSGPPIKKVSDPKYTEIGGIFDIMSFTVIEHHLAVAL